MKPVLCTIAAALFVAGCASAETNDTDVTMGDVSTANDTTLVLVDTSTGPDATTITTNPPDMSNDTGTVDTSVPPDTNTLVDTVTDTAVGVPDIPDTVGAMAPVGAACGASAACPVDGPGWPDCISDVCQDGFCLLSFDAQGYCTQGCTMDSDCNPDPGSVVGQAFSCVAGLCAPGSQSACDANNDCANGEVCKFAFEDDGNGGLQLTTACQTATQGGAAPGDVCNDDPAVGQVARCANDMCFGSRCSGVCGGGQSCGSGGQFECVSGVDVDGNGLLRDFCLGRTCTVESDCDTQRGFHCAPAFISGAAPNDQITSRCNFTTVAGDLAPNGTLCTDDAECDSGWCLQDGTTTSHCSTRCSGDNDCASSQICETLLVPLSSSTQPLPVCIDTPGTQSTCTGNGSCSNGEVCRVHLTGTVSPADPFQLSGSVRTICGPAVEPGGSVLGADCSVTPCQNDFCVSLDGGITEFCTAPCVTDSDCSSAGMVCGGELPLYTNPDMTDIRASLCLP